MKTMITAIFVLFATVALAQNEPRKHVFYDTVQQVKTRVDYSPDTIPVYFKELVIEHKHSGKRQDGLFGADSLYERWNAGFVVWQTYRKLEAVYSQMSIGTSTYVSSNQSTYYRVEYEPSRLADGKFLYADKKPVSNKVIFSIKR